MKALVHNNEYSSIEKNTNLEIDSIKLKLLADDFYKRFKASPIPVKKIPRFYNDYKSVIILFNDGSGFLVPHFFYQQAQINEKLDYTEIFQKECNWLDLISNIFDFTNKITHKLSKADIKILKAITLYKRTGLFKQMDITNRNNLLIHYKTLSTITNLSEKWVSERFHFLMKNYILFPQYILNPFLFGLNTHLIIYDNYFEKESSFLNEITLFSLKLDHKISIRIIQLPNIESTNDLTLSFRFRSLKINEMKIFNNLSGLSSKISKNFKVVPNFEVFKTPATNPIIEFKRDSSQWVKTLEFDDEEAKKYPFLKKMTFTKRVSSTIRVLNYLARWGIIHGTFSKVSKELRISVVELMETCRFLLDNDMIAFFPRLSRIGCSNRYGILAIDNKGSHAEELNNFYLNLLELPLSVTFPGDNFIFAYVQMPDTYLTEFFRYLTSLQDSLEIRYAMFISLKSWGRFSIPLPEGTTVDEFGVNFPSKVFEKLKTKSN